MIEGVRNGQRFQFFISSGSSERLGWAASVGLLSLEMILFEVFQFSITLCSY